MKDKLIYIFIGGEDEHPSIVFDDKDTAFKWIESESAEGTLYACLLNRRLEEFLYEDGNVYVETKEGDFKEPVIYFTKEN